MTKMFLILATITGVCALGVVICLIEKAIERLQQ